jgi:diadenosine tetraphosphate (Ap4A) HIT family hydrolase
VSEPTPDCIFCAIVAGRADASVVHEDETAVAFLDIHPITPGHALVVPRRHAASLAELDAGDGGHLFQVAMRVAAALRASPLRVEGMNLFLSDGHAAGQDVFHVHLHVLPRFTGDCRQFSLSGGCARKAFPSGVDDEADGRLGLGAAAHRHGRPLSFHDPRRHFAARVCEDDGSAFLTHEPKVAECVRPEPPAHVDLRGLHRGRVERPPAVEVEWEAAGGDELRHALHVGGLHAPELDAPRQHEDIGGEAVATLV